MGFETLWFISHLDWYGGLFGLISMISPILVLDVQIHETKC
jgi:hypothetical protein